MYLVYTAGVVALSYFNLKRLCKNDIFQAAKKIIWLPENILGKNAMPKIKTSDCEFELPRGANLLQALEITGHSVEYQCRGGYCGSCRVKLVSGSVRYADLPMAFVAADEILPCCCVVEQDIEIICKLRQTDKS